MYKTFPQVNENTLFMEYVTCCQGNNNMARPVDRVSVHASTDAHFIKLISLMVKLGHNADTTADSKSIFLSSHIRLASRKINKREVQTTLWFLFLDGNFSFLPICAIPIKMAEQLRRHDLQPNSRPVRGFPSSKQVCIASEPSTSLK